MNNINLKFAFVLFAAGSTCFMTANAADVNDASRSTWKPVMSADGSLPVKRHEAAYVGLGDKFFLVGGRRMNPVSIFDPRTRKWTEGAVPPIELHHFQPVVHGKKVYVAGALVHFEDRIYVASGCGNRGGSPELTTQETLQLK